MNRALAICITAAILAFARAAAACSPCDDPLSLRKTAEWADIVVVATRTSDGIGLDAGQTGVEYAAFEIQQVLKGEPPSHQIWVATQYGMCTGVEVERNSPYVLFLQAYRGLYGTVRGGCAARTLPVVKGKVVLSDISVPIETLVSEIGLSLLTATKKSPWEPWPYAIAVLGAVLGLLVGLGIGRRRSR